MDNSIFSFRNTIIVNDKPAKHVTNDPQNMLLFDSWSYEGYGARDGILIHHLLPWIQRLHLGRPWILHYFHSDDPMGKFHLVQEPDKTEFRKL